MSSTIVIVVLGLLGFSLGVPVDQPYKYNPLDFFSNNRIVGGAVADERLAPHMAALLVGDFIRSLMCGASVASYRYIVTAAHCIEPMTSWSGGLIPSAHGAVGTNRWADDRKLIHFSGYLLHPEYNRWTIKYDIGLLTMVDELEFSPRVSPIAMNFDFIGGGQEIYVTGWGTTSVWGAIPDKLQVLHKAILSPQECEDGVRDAQAILGPSPHVDSTVEICTRSPRGAGEGLCHGDSGSALVDETGKQVGLVSWGFPCALGHPDMHARISAFKDFLEILNVKCQVGTK